DVEVRAVWTCDPQAHVGAAKANVGPAADRDEDAVARLCLHDDFVPVATPHQLDARVLDEVADRVVVRDGLELHVRLIRVPGLDLDLPGGYLEVQAQGARSGVGLAAHQMMKRPASRCLKSPRICSRACVVFSKRTRTRGSSSRSLSASRRGMSASASPNGR